MEAKSDTEKVISLQDRPRTKTETVGHSQDKIYSNRSYGGRPMEAATFELQLGSTMGSSAMSTGCLTYNSFGM